MHRNTLFFGLLILLLASCSQPQEATINPATVTPDTGYPAPLDSSLDTGYPGPAFLTPISSESSHLSDTLDIPEPSADTGIVYGQLLAPVSPHGHLANDLSCPGIQCRIHFPGYDRAHFCRVAGSVHHHLGPDGQGIHVEADLFYREPLKYQPVHFFMVFFSLTLKKIL